jgi:hypothetical protein
MTDTAVDISITIKVGKKEAEIIKEINGKELEIGMASFGQEISGKASVMVLEALDDRIREEIPASWQNVGRESRYITMEHGFLLYERRIYKDDQGKRRKPLDELLGIVKYARTSCKVQEMASVLAAQTTYRMAASSLSCLMKTSFSPSSIQRMVWQTGKRILESEECNQEISGSKVAVPVLYGESDGVWIHMQRESQRKKEVKVAVMYTGKKRIGKDRYRLENKVIMTQLGGKTNDWQVKLRELADRNFHLDHVKLMAIGGDGSDWVEQSFDLLNLPHTHLLDRFHVMRAIRQSYGGELVLSEIYKDLFSDGFDAVSDTLYDCIKTAKGKKKEEMQKTYYYLRNHQDALVDLDKRGFDNLNFSSMGSIEGNVDKTVVHRMEGRGCCWRTEGATAMLAILRHRDELQRHCFKYLSVPPIPKRFNRVKNTLAQQAYQPISGSVPLFQGCDQTIPWVKSFKNKLNYGLSINGFF